MQKRLSEVIDFLDVSRRRLIETVANVHPSFAAIRPRGDAWSVSEIVNHLAMVERSVAKMVARSVLWGRENGIARETSGESIMSTLDRFSIVEPLRPIAAPEQLIPAHESSVDEALNLLADSRRALLAALSEGDGMDLSAITRPHRVLGELNIYQWALFIGQHEERHRRQIERTLRDLTESAAESAPIF